MELAKKIISVIKQNIEWKGEIRLHDHLIDDLNIDSFDRLMIVAALEDEFSIQIEEEVIDPDDVDMLQDLILAAINDALAKSQEMASGEMSKLTGGVNIPGLM